MSRYTKHYSLVMPVFLWHIFSPNHDTSLCSFRKLHLTHPKAISSRSSIMALRYSRWARLIDEKKTVSKFHFDVQADQNVEEHREGGSDPNSTRLLKVIPTYAYRHRRMTEKDLYLDMASASERWEDLREQIVGDRNEKIIGSLHAEVLACHGLVRQCWCFYLRICSSYHAPDVNFSLNWTSCR